MGFVEIWTGNETWVNADKLKFFILRKSFDKVPSSLLSQCLALFVGLAILGFSIGPVIGCEMSLLWVCSFPH